MRISDKEFYTEKLDLSIPEMKTAQELYLSGRESDAASAFAKYFKNSLNSDIIFKLQPNAMTDGIPEGHTLLTYADLVVEGCMYAIGFLHRYENKRVVWDYNPTYNGYVEYCFHLNGHGDLSALAYAYRETGEERYAVRFAELMRSWLDDTECPGKVVCDIGRPTWRSIESGCRMIRWPAFIASFAGSENIPDRLWLDMAKSIAEHMHRLIGLNTKYNWHTSEITGVLTASIHYSFFREASSWREWAIAEYKQQVAREIYPDGMQQELSSSYQNSVAYNFRYASHLLEEYGYEAPKELGEGVYKILSCYPKLSRPDLHSPALNDGIALYIPDVFSSKRDMLPADDDVLNYFMSERREGRKPDYNTVVMPYSGFVIMRSGWEADDIWSLFDVGPEGTAHIHEDKLNFLLYAYGENMLNDIGFYAYDTSDMRYFSTSSLSHNTGLVDGEGQNRIATHKWGAGIETVEIQTPAWGEYAEQYKVQDLSFSDTGDTEIAEASYCGDYGKRLTKAAHVRKVVFFKRGLGNAKPFFLLLDSFTSGDDAEHEFSVCFQHRAIPISVEGNRTTLKFPSGATLTTVCDVCPSILVGQYTPRYVGWNPIHSPYEHEHTPAPFVEYKKRGKSARFATLIYPSRDLGRPSLNVSLRDGGFVLDIDGECFEFDYDDKRLIAEKYTVNKR